MNAIPEVAAISCQDHNAEATPAQPPLVELIAAYNTAHDIWETLAPEDPSDADARDLTYATWGRLLAYRPGAVAELAPWSDALRRLGDETDRHVDVLDAVNEAIKALAGGPAPADLLAPSGFSPNLPEFSEELGERYICWLHTEIIAMQHHLGIQLGAVPMDRMVSVVGREQGLEARAVGFLWAAGVSVEPDPHSILRRIERGEIGEPRAEVGMAQAAE